MRNKLIHIFCILFTGLLLTGCSKDKSDFAGKDNYIVSFEMKIGEESYKAVILDDEIRLTVPKGTDLSEGKPNISLCENVRLSPDPLTITNWGEEYQFIATSHNNSDRIYKYTIIHPEVSIDGNVILNTQADVDAFARSGIDIVRGNLIIGTEQGGNGLDSIRNLEGLENLLEVEYNIIINETFAGETINLKHLRKMYSMTRTASLSNKQYICRNLKNIILPELTEVVSGITIKQPHIQQVVIPKLTRIGGNMTIETDGLNVVDLTSLESVQGNLSFTSGRDGKKLETLSFPALKELKGSLSITGMTQLTNINLPQLVSAGGFNLSGCTKISNLTNSIIENLTGALSLSGNTMLMEVHFPALKTAETIKIVDGTIGFIDFTALTEAGTLEMENLTIMNLSGFKSLQKTAKLTLTNMELIESFDGLESFQSVGDLILDRIPFKGELNLNELHISNSMQLKGTTLNVPKIVGPEILDCNISMSGWGFYNITKPPLFEGIKQVKSLKYNFQELGAIDIDLGDITYIAESLDIYGDYRFFRTVTANHLTRVGSLSINGIGKSYDEDIRYYKFPLLEAIDGDAYIDTDANGSIPEGINFPNLTSVGGKLEFRPGNWSKLESIRCQSLVSIGGALKLYSSSRATLNMVDFSKLERAAEVTINNVSITNFSTFEKVIPNLNNDTWKVTKSAYNPTYQNMLDKEYTEQSQP